MTIFTETVNSRETSTEIMEAINWLARGNSAEAERIWDAPTDAEMLAIWERVTDNGLRATGDCVWGAAGENWMPK